MKVIKGPGMLRTCLIAAAIVSTASAQAESIIEISDGSVLSLELGSEGCMLTHRLDNNTNWLDLHAVDDTSDDRFDFRWGEAHGRAVERLEIQITGKPSYGPVSLFDVLEAELLANMGSWSADRLAQQEDALDAADGQPLNALGDISISINVTKARASFKEVRSSELVAPPRVASVTVSAPSIDVSNGCD